MSIARLYLELSGTIKRYILSNPLFSEMQIFVNTFRTKIQKAKLENKKYIRASSAVNAVIRGIRRTVYETLFSGYKKILSYWHTLS